MMHEEPQNSTTGQHHMTAPQDSTTGQHHRTAPQDSTTGQHLAGNGLNSLSWELLLLLVLGHQRGTTRSPLTHLGTWRECTATTGSPEPLRVLSPPSDRCGDPTSRPSRAQALHGPSLCPDPSSGGTVDTPAPEEGQHYYKQENGALLVFLHDLWWIPQKIWNCYILYSLLRNDPTCLTNDPIYIVDFDAYLIITTNLIF